MVTEGGDSEPSSPETRGSLGHPPEQSIRKETGLSQWAALPTLCKARRSSPLGEGKVVGKRVEREGRGKGGGGGVSLPSPLHALRGVLPISADSVSHPVLIKSPSIGIRFLPTLWLLQALHFDQHQKKKC